MASFSYSTLNGGVGTLNNVTDELLFCLNTYNYVVFKSGSNVIVCLFDNEIECISSSSNYLINYNQNNTFFKTFRYFTAAKRWNNYSDNSYSFDESFNINGCKENLLEYSELLKTGNFSINLSQEELSMFTLRSIVQEVDEREDILKSTFTEVFSILPVLITVLISYIGIRKGIFFLLSQINKS